MRLEVRLPPCHHEDREEKERRSWDIVVPEEALPSPGLPVSGLLMWRKNEHSLIKLDSITCSQTQSPMFRFLVKQI